MNNVLRAPYNGYLDPVHACRVMPTRHCPAVYGSVCGDRPCARYESEDETPWLPELPAETMSAADAFLDWLRTRGRMHEDAA